MHCALFCHPELAEGSRRSYQRELVRIAMVNVLQSRDLSTSRRRRFAQGDRLLIMYNHRNTFFSFRKKSYFCIANNSLYYFLRCGFVGGIILNKYAQNRWGLAARERYTNEPVKRRGVVCSCAYFFIMQTTPLVRIPMQTRRKAGCRRFPPSNIPIRFRSHPPD